MTTDTRAADPLAPRDLDQLRRTSGEVITADDASYDEARRLWNAIHDRRPAVIVRPTSAERVAAAVRFARDHDLVIAVRSGGMPAPASTRSAASTSPTIVSSSIACMCSTTLSNWS